MLAQPRLRLLALPLDLILLVEVAVEVKLVLVLKLLALAPSFLPLLVEEAVVVVVPPLEGSRPSAQ